MVMAIGCCSAIPSPISSGGDAEPLALCAAAGQRGAAVHELHHQALRHAQHPRHQRLLNKALVALACWMRRLGLPLQPACRAHHDGRGVSAVRRSCPVFCRSNAFPLDSFRPRPISARGPGNRFRHVVLPLSLPGTIVGGLFVFILAMGDFVTPQMVGGPSLHLRPGDPEPVRHGLQLAAGSALAVILLIVVLAVIDWPARSAAAAGW